MVGRRRSNNDDLISQMPDEILVMILSLLSIKSAVVTSSLSKRWRFLWCNLIQLNFDGCDTYEMAYRSEQDKFVDQVNSVIQSYNHPTVQDFRIRFGLNNRHKGVIDNWLQFAVNKQVEFLQLDFTNPTCGSMYQFPLRLFERDLVRSNATVVELVSLKKLYLKSVNVNEAILQEFLTNSPLLETVSIHDSEYLENHIRIGGRPLNLKHLEIVDCHFVESIYLYDFDLVSFICNGRDTELRFDHLPKLRQLEICRSWESNVYSLQDFSNHPMRDSVPKLKNIKKLRLKLCGSKYTCLLQLAFMVNACPNLETLTAEPYWTSPIMKKTRDATNPHEPEANSVWGQDLPTNSSWIRHCHDHLKFVEIVGYYGRSSDFEVAAFLIHTAVALKKIVIDTRGKQDMWNAVDRFFSQNKEAARSFIEHKVVPLLPQGAELIIKL